MVANLRPNEAPVKVICLGLGRTGTSSLGSALEILGFGPFYHMFKIFGGNLTEDVNNWINLSEGIGSAEDLDRMFHGYQSVLDYPAANYPKELYNAYPRAKFILTVRNTEKWEKSMKETLIPFNNALASTCPSELPPTAAAVSKWWQLYGPNGASQQGYDLPTVFSRHTELVKAIIPSDQLLVYEVSEGWKPLVEFLEVPEPSVAFPHVNDAAEFKKYDIKSPN
ncbi:hypothetical protein JAAARDRAFT_210388 [Jaapia argillacea MUCL 33604]|uniref:Sulfotransferase domain-containing protein n=1 Tax=Jaapia argillacea MUCL 33604 TaxID=933084 RepID=A0A067PD32_9AGAM|nr:hypothetical protein JAAARDRAFT_210388 [Jaapia argillacea MUCL 33604]